MAEHEVLLDDIEQENNKTIKKRQQIDENRRQRKYLDLQEVYTLDIPVADICAKTVSLDAKLQNWVFHSFANQITMKLSKYHPNYFLLIGGFGGICGVRRVENAESVHALKTVS